MPYTILFLCFSRSPPSTSIRGQNINDQANHPKRTWATPRHEERGEACNCRELAKCRIGGGSTAECVHGTGRIPGLRMGLLRGRRNGLTVFVDDPSLTSTLRNRDAEYVFRMLVGVRVTWKGNEESLWSKRD